MIVGERLRIIRESKELSQGDIEIKTGLLRCYVSRVENGHTVPSVETLQKWVRALGITMSQLFAEDDREPSVLPALKNNHAPKLSRMAANQLRKIETAFAHMDPRDIMIVSTMARKFAQR
jgi:transcriptional regulator with XRE-family HTH domain